MKIVPTNLSNFESKVDKLDVDNLVTVPVDVSKLSDVVRKDITRLDADNAKITIIEDKTTDVTNIAINTSLNA